MSNIGSFDSHDGEEMYDYPPPVHVRDYVIKGCVALVAVASLLFVGRVFALALRDIHNPRGIDVPYRSV